MGILRGRRGRLGDLAASAVVSIGIAAAALWPSEAWARDFVRVVGSSTVFPFTARVAHEFKSKTEWSAVVDSTGTGGGLRAFCEGVGDAYPDIAGASRRITPAEFEDCANRGINAISELMVGRDGIVVARSLEGEEANFTRKHLYLALAEKVVVDGAIIDNPFTMWSQIDDSLPNTAIKVYGPPSTSGTRDTFLTLALKAGCDSFTEIKDLSKEDQKKVCTTLRADGAYETMGEDDTVTIRQLQDHPEAYGIFGYSYAHNNEQLIVANSIEGVFPDIDTIADETYPLARPLYIYVKNQHLSLTQALKPFVLEYTSENALGDEGYLVGLGLVPLKSYERNFMRGAAEGSTPMQPPK